MLIKNDRIYMTVSYYERNRAKEIVDYKWHPEKKQWSWPLELAEDVVKIFPDTKPVLQKYIGLRETIEKVFVRPEWRDKYKFKVPPYVHQFNMIQKLLENKQYALFCEMGTGKTKPIIDAFGILKEKGEVKHCLVVCPKTVIEGWCSKIEKNSDLSFTVIGKKWGKDLTEQVDFYIVNYERVRTIKDRTLFEKINMVVLDESHKIKNHQAKQTKCLLALFQNRDIRKYLLTGTPISQNSIDIFSQFKFLNQSFLKFSSYYSCRTYYCVMGGYGNYQVIGYKNEQELRERIAAHSLQLKKENCLDLPPKVYEKLWMDMPAAIQKQYVQMSKELIIELENEAITASISLVKILRLQEILAGHYIEKKDNVKLRELKTLLEDNKEKKIIIWCHYIKTLKLIEGVVQELNLDYSLIYGAIKDRKEQQDMFNDGKNDVLIGQIATGGVGIDLASASMVIYFENEYSMTNRLQSEDRAHRIGQKNRVTYVDMLYRKTIDEQILKAIQKKETTATFLVDSFKKGER